MTFGAGDKKKLWFLGVLVVVMAYFMYSNLFSGPDVSRSNSTPVAETARPGAALPVPEGAPGPRTAPRSRARSDEFHPMIGTKNKEKAPAPTEIDPTLRTDLLAKVQAVELVGGSRNLFQFGAAPAPKAELPKGPEPKIVAFRKVGPEPPPPPPPPPPKPPDPKPPPIPLKYYAFWVSRDNGKRTACFMESNGEDILMAAEGETLKKRYRVVRINPTSVVMEDLEFKGQQQTLDLTPEAQGG